MNLILIFFEPPVYCTKKQVDFWAISRKCSVGLDSRKNIWYYIYSQSATAWKIKRVQKEFKNCLQEKVLTAWKSCDIIK